MRNLLNDPYTPEELADIERRRQEREASGLRSTCAHCGEPVVKVESPLDNIWRWRHEVYGVIRTHVAVPVGEGEQ